MRAATSHVPKGYRGAHLDPGHLLPQLRGRQGAQPPQPERLREGGARRQSHSQQQVGIKQITHVLTYIHTIWFKMDTEVSKTFIGLSLTMSTLFLVPRSAKKPH